MRQRRSRSKWEEGEWQGGVEERKTVIRIYYVKNNLFFIFFNNLFLIKEEKRKFKYNKGTIGPKVCENIRMFIRYIRI